MKKLVERINNSYQNLLCHSLKCLAIFSQPSDKKSAESVHPNLIRATVGGEQEEEQEEDGHADAQT